MNFSGIKNIIKLLFIIPFLIGIWSIVLIQLGLINVNVDLPDRDDMLEAYQKAEQANRDNTLAAYQKEAQLDQDNAEGWNQLGLLLFRTGELTQAEEAFRKVLALGEAHQDQEEQARASQQSGHCISDMGGAGQGRRDAQEGFELHKALGSKEGMAANYGSLGLMYRIRGELDKAEEMHRKALELDKALGRKEGMAQDYGNLGSVYVTLGEMDKAEEMYRNSLDISKALGLKQVSANQYSSLGLLYIGYGGN
ncbi:hypothetical protein GKODMF_01885 [Candidatus Electrothrix gigas]